MIQTIDFAPLDGITKIVFRQVWSQFFGGVDRYFIPFFSPTPHHLMTPRDLREVDYIHNAALPSVPQVMTKNANDFLWACDVLKDMGYTEVNLNLGCPSGTVTAKGKGSGFLAHPNELAAFFDEMFSKNPLPVSVKTRLGYETPEEFAALLDLYNRYPIACLTVHPRVRKEKYRGPVHLDVFADALANGGSVRCIVAKDAAATLTRKAIDKLTEQAKGIGAKGLAYIRWADEKPNCSFAKFMSEEELTALLHTLGCQQGDVVLIVADKDRVVLPVLGQLRLTLGKQLGLIPEGKYNFLWITEFPFFEWDEESQSWLAMHHPFTMPLEECLPYIDSDPGSVRAQAYDMVVNGVELLSGSIRITDYELQQKMFEALGLTEEEIEAKFGFLVDAYKYGAPPHGGAALGLDRIVMTMCGCDNLRDVVAFPKVQNASELMSQCPSPVDKKSLDELAIAVTEFEKDE